MKKIGLITVAFIALWGFTNCKVNAQGVGINASGSNPDPSAIIDASSTTKGALIPRVSLSSTIDVSTVATPATYLTVYNTNASMTNGNGAGMYYYDGSKWVYMAAASNGPGTSGQVLLSNGANASPSWGNASGGPQSCPAGFSTVNAQYCIETNERSATGWFTAVATCVSAGGQLCSWAQFYGACNLGIGNNMTDNYEWVDDAMDHAAIGVKKVGGGSCTNANGAYTSENYPYRCCFSR